MKRVRGNNNCYIGVDNGSSGSIGFVGNGFDDFRLTPSKRELNYQKSKQYIVRVNYIELFTLLKAYSHMNIKLVMERPFTGKFNKQNTNAGRACEATLIAIEMLKIPFVGYIDSKEWQKVLLPRGIKGGAELKKASKQVGIRMFPQHRELIEKHGDADGLLIAEYLRGLTYEV